MARSFPSRSHALPFLAGVALFAAGCKARGFNTEVKGLVPASKAQPVESKPTLLVKDLPADQCAGYFDEKTRALKAVFGVHARRLAISSTKSMTGHLMGAAGAMEAAVCALALQRGAIPPTINLTETDPECDLDYVPGEARDVRPRVALSNSFGFGGMNASLVLGTA